MEPPPDAGSPPPSPSPGAGTPAEQAEQAALRVVRRLRDLGHAAYFAGGCVRDRLLARVPNDVDVATSARPEQVRAAFRRTIPVGVQFGIVIVMEGGHKVEVATFRVDGAYDDHRRPSSVTFTGPEEDAARRDFTVNGLFYDPLEDRVLDFVGGLDDLRRGAVRAIGDPEARFDEDRLRILRAPRFAAALGFALEARTTAAARLHAPEVVSVSPERIRVELDKVVSHRTRARGVALCHEVGVLRVVLPEVEDVPRACRALAALPAAAPPPLAWAALLHLAGPDRAGDALVRLRSSNRDVTATVALLAQLAPARDLGAHTVAGQKRLLRPPFREELAELVRAVALGGDGDLEPYRFLRARIAAFAAERGPAALDAPPLASGKDLLAAGFAPGPLLGRVLARLEEAQLEGRVTTRDAAVDLARSVAAADAASGAGGGERRPPG